MSFKKVFPIFKPIHTTLFLQYINAIVEEAMVMTSVRKLHVGRIFINFKSK